MPATQIAKDWNRQEAVRVVEELEALVGRLGANCPDSIRQHVLQARHEAWGDLIDNHNCKDSWHGAIHKEANCPTCNAAR